MFLTLYDVLCAVRAAGALFGIARGEIVRRVEALREHEKALQQAACGALHFYY